jgi:hypothetical protein
VADGLILKYTLKIDIIGRGLQEDILRGLDGADILRGYGGADWLYGGESTDTLNAGSDDYFIFGGNTEDDLRDVVYAGDGDDQLSDTALSDLIFSGNGFNSIKGGFGHDRLNVVMGAAGSFILGSLITGQIGYRTMIRLKVISWSEVGTAPRLMLRSPGSVRRL